VLACVLASLGGCDAGPSAAKPDDLTPIEGETLPSPVQAAEMLMPVRLRVHPLSRLERDELGRAQLVVQMELLDDSGHSGKWLGRASASIERLAGPAPGDAPTDTTRRFNLTSAQASGARFDWITRTYVLRLTPLPAWYDGLVDGSDRDAAARVRCSFTFLDASGTARTLEDTATIRALR
jgi:hypothetical protein